MFTISTDTFDKYLEMEEDPNEEKDINKIQNFSPKNMNSNLNEEYEDEVKNNKMKEYNINDLLLQIRQECENFLMSEFKLILLFSLVLTIFFYIVGKRDMASYFCISFLMGVIITLISGFVITRVAVKNIQKLVSNVDMGISVAFKLCIQSSSRMSVLMMTISFFSFFGFSLLLKYFLAENKETFEILCGYGLGCSYTALFGRISGGIFTKGADISCDIVGKLEENFKENDCKNPSSIADNIGDLVGDLVGSLFDLLASIAETLCAVSLIISYMQNTNEEIYNLIVFFFTLFSTALLVFIIIDFIIAYMTRPKENSFEHQIISETDIEDYLFKLIRWTTSAMILITIVYFALLAPTDIIFNGVIISKYNILITVLLGLIAGYLITYSTYYYTGKSFR